MKARRADDMRRIAETMTNPKDAEMVRTYASELDAATRLNPLAGSVRANARDGKARRQGG